MKRVLKRLLGFGNAKSSERDLNKLQTLGRVTMGEGYRLRKPPYFYVVDGASVICGDRVVLNSDQAGYHAAMSFPVTILADRRGAKITIGPDCRIHGSLIHAWKSVTLGRKCLLAAGTQIMDSNGHSTDLKHARLRTEVQDTAQEIVIGDFVWTGLGALILKGARIGEGCIVAAHSVVLSGDYPPFSLIAGAPAKVVKTLPPEEVLPEDYSREQLTAEGWLLHNF